MRWLCLLLVVFLLNGCAAPQPQHEAAPPRAGLFDYEPIPFSLHTRAISSHHGVTTHAMSYASPIAGRVTGYLVAPSKPGSHAGIVFGHWGYGEATEFLAEAQLYAQAGAVCLLIDYPWVRPAPWRRNLAAGLGEPEVDRDRFVESIVDLRRGIDLLATRDDVDSNHLAYVGHSYGAQWGAILSAIDRRLHAVVLIGGVGALSDILLDNDDPANVAMRERTDQQVLDRYLAVHGELDGIRYVPHAAPTPILFQFARYERYFDEASMERYADAASEPKEVRWYETGHGVNDIQALLDRAAWLERHIGIESIAPIVGSKLDSLGVTEGDSP